MGKHPKRPGRARTEVVEEGAVLYLREWIDALGADRGDLCACAGITQGRLSQLENREKYNDNPRLPLAFKIADCLGVKLDQLRHPPPPRAFIQEAERTDPELLRRLYKG